MRKKLAAVVLATTLVGSGVGLAACETPTTDNGGVSQGVGSKDASGDVKLGELQSAYGMTNIPVTIRNSSEKTSDYNIEATLYDSESSNIGTAFAYVQAVKPGGKATGTLTSMQNGTPVKAHLSLVERTATTP